MGFNIFGGKDKKKMSIGNRKFAKIVEKVSFY